MVFRAQILLLLISSPAWAANIPVLLVHYREAIEKKNAEQIALCEAEAQLNLDELSEQPSMMKYSKNRAGVSRILDAKIKAKRLGFEVDFAIVGKFWENLESSSRLSILNFWNEYPEYISWSSLLGIAMTVNSDLNPFEMTELAGIYSNLKDDQKELLKKYFSGLRLGDTKKYILNLLREFSRTTEPTAEDLKKIDDLIKSIHAYSPIREHNAPVSFSSKLIFIFRMLSAHYPEKPTEELYINGFRGLGINDLQIFTSFIIDMKMAVNSFFDGVIEDQSNLTHYKMQKDFLRNITAFLPSFKEEPTKSLKDLLEDLKHSIAHLEISVLDNFFNERTPVPIKLQTAKFLLGNRDNPPTKEGIYAVFLDPRSVARTDRDAALAVLKWIDYQAHMNNIPQEIKDALLGKADSGFLESALNRALNENWAREFFDAYGNFLLNSRNLASNFLLNQNSAKGMSNLNLLIPYFQNSLKDIILSSQSEPNTINASFWMQKYWTFIIESRQARNFLLLEMASAKKNLLGSAELGDIALKLNDSLLRSISQNRKIGSEVKEDYSSFSMFLHSCLKEEEMGFWIDYSLDAFETHKKDEEFHIQEKAILEARTFLKDTLKGTLKNCIDNTLGTDDNLPTSN